MEKSHRVNPSPSEEEKKDTCNKLSKLKRELTSISLIGTTARYSDTVSL